MDAIILQSPKIVFSYIYVIILISNHQIKIQRWSGQKIHEEHFG